MILRKDFENLSKTFAKFSNELICELLGIKGTAKRLFNALTKLSKELANELFGTKGTSMEQLECDGISLWSTCEALEQTGLWSVCKALEQTEKQSKMNVDAAKHIDYAGNWFVERL